MDEREDDGPADVAMRISDLRSAIGDRGETLVGKQGDRDGGEQAWRRRVVCRGDRFKREPGQPQPRAGKNCDTADLDEGAGQGKTADPFITRDVDQKRRQE